MCTQHVFIEHRITHTRGGNNSTAGAGAGARLTHAGAALARHAPAVRRECYWTATGPQRHCGTDDGDTGNWKMVAMMAIIAMLSIYPSSKQPGPQPLPPSAGGGHILTLFEFNCNVNNGKNNANKFIKLNLS